MEVEARFRVVGGSGFVSKGTIGLILAFLGVGLLSAYSASPPRPEIRGISPFDLQRYLGTWYEIARLENTFERGLSHVTAVYTLRPDGKVGVLNRGYNARQGVWKEVNGTAKFAGSPTVAELSVSFFWPFSSPYRVIALDQQGYQYAMVAGKGRKYLWILSRKPTLSRAIVRQLIEEAKALGFDTDRLIFVKQEPLPSRGS